MNEEDKRYWWAFKVTAPFWVGVVLGLVVIWAVFFRG